MTTNFIHTPFTDQSAYINALSSHAADAVKTRGRHLDRNAVARFPIFAKAYARKIITPDLWEGLNGNAKAQEHAASAYFLDHQVMLGEIPATVHDVKFESLLQRAFAEIYMAEHGIDSEGYDEFLSLAVAYAEKRFNDFIPRFDDATKALVEQGTAVKAFLDKVADHAPWFLPVEAWEACQDDAETLTEFHELLFLHVYAEMFEAVEDTPAEPNPARTKGKKTTSRRKV